MARSIDLDPLDVRADEDVRWLQALIWPEHEARRRRLAAVVAMARTDPPMLRRGGALEELESVAALAPAGARLVVLHSAVLAYLTESDRQAFVDAVRGLDATWLSVEGPGVLPLITARLHPSQVPDRDFVVALDGVPIGLMGPHGQRYRELRRP